MFHLKLAWRNIFRNKKRTLIAGLAIGTGLAALIFTDALMDGMHVNLINSVTDTWMGDAQIHQEEYMEMQEAGLVVNDGETLIEKLREDGRIKAVSGRILADGMLSSSYDASSVTVAGIDPVAEKSLSRIDEGIVEGSYLEHGQGNGILIGKKLSEMLEVYPGDRLVLTVTDQETGELSQELFRVTGIFFLNIEEMERGMVFIPLKTAQKMTGLGRGLNEIALDFNEQSLGMDDSDPFYRDYSADGNRASSWLSLMPQMRMVLGMKSISMSVMGLIIFGIVIFGIMNTLFMSIYERMFEFGVMRAVGTSKGSMRKLILLEAFSLSVISAVIGMILGLLITYAVSRTGIDYKGIEMAGGTMTELLYPILSARQFVFYPLSIIVFTVIAGIYPAVAASKMTIAGAMRKSL